MDENLGYELGKVADYLGEYLPGGDVAALWQQVQAGELALDWQLPGRVALAVLGGQAAAVLHLFGYLLVVAVLGMLLAGLQDGGVGRLAAQVMSLAAALPAVQALLLAGQDAAEALKLMGDFLYALLPVLLSLLAALGGEATVALFNPALLLAVSTSLHVLRVFVLPMLCVSGALAVGGRLPGGLKLAGLAKLLRDVAAGVFGVMLTVFGGLLGVLGLSSAALSGLGWRAAKAAGSAFIPVVGRTLADALDSVVGTALLVKGAVGLAGMLLVLLLCMVPGVKLLLVYLTFRLAAALAEPLGNAELAALLGDMAQVVVMLFAVVAAAGLFFFFLIGIVIGMGNVMVALR